MDTYLTAAADSKTSRACSRLKLIYTGCVRYVRSWPVSLLVVLIVLTSGLLLYVSDCWSNELAAVRPNLIADLIGLLVGLLLLDRYRKGTAKAKWARVEKQIRERSIKAMYCSTAMMEEATRVEDDSADLRFTEPGADLMPLQELHEQRISHTLMSRTGDLVLDKALPFYPLIVTNLDALISELDYVTGHFLEQLTQDELEPLLNARLKASYLRNQLKLLLALLGQGSKPAGIYASTLTSIPAKATGFLQSLLAAERAWAQAYKKLVDATKA